MQYFHAPLLFTLLVGYGECSGAKTFSSPISLDTTDQALICLGADINKNNFCTN